MKRQIAKPESLHGLLRAVHLDNDWLELAVDNERVRVIAVSEEVDDVIGPLSQQARDRARVPRRR